MRRGVFEVQYWVVMWARVSLGAVMCACVYLRGRASRCGLRASVCVCLWARACECLPIGIALCLACICVWACTCFTAL